MIRIKARDIFNMNREDVWAIKMGKYLVEYEDGVEIEENKKAIIFNRYCWELIKMYPDTPIIKECDVSSYLGVNSFNIKTTTQLLEGIFNHTCFHNKLFYYKDKNNLLERVYQVRSLIANEIVHRVSNHVATIDATDIVTLINSKEVKEIHSKLEPLPLSVERTYKRLKDYVSTQGFDDNFLAAFKSGTINDNQAYQGIGPRGFVTDLDRTVFKRPIVNGFMRGMGSLYEMMTESLTASKSLSSSEKSIKTSEYGSRRIQLSTMSVLSPTNQDCGSTDYVELVVTESYLKNLSGKWYIVNEGDKLKYIKGDETHLLDKSIKIRSGLTCRHPDPSRICTRCLGRISENFPENSNLGYTSTAYLMEKITQTLLSFKHLIQSVRASRIILTSGASKYFIVGGEGDDIYLSPDVDFTNLSLMLPSKKLSKLTDALNMTSRGVSVNRIGDLEYVWIKDTSNADLSPPKQVNVSYMDRLANISRDLLKHIRTSNYVVDVKGNYIIPLDKFNRNLPFLTIPLKESSLISFSNKVVSKIELTNRKNKDTIFEHFFDLCDLIYKQFNCPMTLLEIIIYGTSSFNPKEEDFRLGRNSPNMRQTNRTNLFMHRSISSFLAYEKQMSSIAAYPDVIFSDKHRPTHPLDTLFVPQYLIK